MCTSAPLFGMPTRHGHHASRTLDKGGSCAMGTVDMDRHWAQSKCGMRQTYKTVLGSIGRGNTCS